MTHHYLRYTPPARGSPCAQMPIAPCGGPRHGPCPFGPSRLGGQDAGMDDHVALRDAFEFLGIPIPPTLK